MVRCPRGGAVFVVIVVGNAGACGQAAMGGDLAAVDTGLVFDADEPGKCVAFIGHFDLRETKIAHILAVELLQDARKALEAVGIRDARLANISGGLEVVHRAGLAGLVQGIADDGDVIERAAGLVIGAGALDALAVVAQIGAAQVLAIGVHVAGDTDVIATHGSRGIGAMAVVVAFDAGAGWAVAKRCVRKPAAVVTALASHAAIAVQVTARRFGCAVRALGTLHAGVLSTALRRFPRAHRTGITRIPIDATRLRCAPVEP